jgi:hypothetical protein
MAEKCRGKKRKHVRGSEAWPSPKITGSDHCNSFVQRIAKMRLPTSVLSLPSHLNQRIATAFVRVGPYPPKMAQGLLIHGEKARGVDPLWEREMDHEIGGDHMGKQDISGCGFSKRSPRFGHRGAKRAESASRTLQRGFSLPSRQETGRPGR